MRNHVLKHEFSFFQALQLKFVHQRVFHQADDHVVQIAVFDAQFDEPALVVFDVAGLHDWVLRGVAV